MKRAEFVERFQKDYKFRNEMKCKGINVICGNVIFSDDRGKITGVAGVHMK